MIHRSAKGKDTRRAWHLLAVLFAVLMTIAPHHGVALAGAQSTHQVVQAIESTAPCHDHDCGQRLALCCAMGMCLGNLPAPYIAADRMTFATRYAKAPPSVPPLWISAGPDRPPKAA